MHVAHQVDHQTRASPQSPRGRGRWAMTTRRGKLR